MANNLSVKIGANTADLEKNINKAKQTLQEYRAAAKQAKNAIEANVSATSKQVNAYDNVIKKLEKVTSGTLSCKQEQKVLTDAVKELKIQWNALTDDQRISGWGQQIADSLKAAESELETTKQKLEAVSDQTNKTSKGMDNVGKSSSKTGNMLGSLNGVLGKVGLAFGAAEVATTLFNGALEKSDEFGDLVANKMAGLTNVIYSLGAALATLDFSGVMNFYEWWKTGENASKAQDDFEDSNQQFKYMFKEAQEAVALAKETGKASDMANASKRINALDSIVTQNATNAINVAKARVAKALKSSKLNNVITEELIERALTATPKQQQIGKDNFERLLTQLEAQAISAAGEARWGPKSQKKLEEIVRSRYNTLLTIAIGAIWSTGSGERQQIFDPVTEAADMKRSVSRLKRQLNGKPDVKTPTRTPTVTVTKTEVQEQKTLIQLYDERIKKAEEELAYHNENYEALNERVLKEREINDLIKERKELEQIDWKAPLPKDNKPVSLLGDIGKDIKDVDKMSKEVSEKLQPELSKIPKMLKKANDAGNETTKQQMDGVKSLAGGISGLGQIIGGTTGEVISMMGKVMGLFPGMIDAIQQMTMAEQARAISSGTAEGAKVPFPGNIAAIAAIVSTIMSVFASIQSFADGGIFSGASRIGDYNIARVNDGEMILNGKQQANLFRMLNDNNAKVANIQYMQPEVRIKGSDIYLSQKNYKNITGRKI